MSGIKECPYPTDPTEYLAGMGELMPFFSAEAIMAGYLAMMVYQENKRQEEKQDWLYSLEYYGGKWLWVRRRGCVYDSYVDVVQRDADATSAIGLAGAIASMRAAAGGR